MESAIRQEALRLGFSACGIAESMPLESLRPFYSSYIQNQRHAGLKYLESNLEKRLNPQLVLEGTKSVIALLMNYYPPETMKYEDNFIIARYAYGRDYHKIVRERLERLVDFLKFTAGDVRAKAFVDSGTVAEKTWAQRCGIGWQGKNSLVIHKKTGSFAFVGIIFTNLCLQPDPPEIDHCGACHRCADACPAGALDTPYQLDIKRCISYYTIEKKDEFPDQMKGKVNNRIFGCDICQDVCPYNHNVFPTSDPAFSPAPGLLTMEKTDWLNLTEEKFSELFNETSIKRTGYTQLLRNIHFAQL